MATKAQSKSRADMMVEVQRLQEAFYQDWLSNSVPGQWEKVPLLYPTHKEKTKVTLTLDKDLAEWFRKLGRGYQARINAILRIYWHGLLSGDIRAHWDVATDQVRGDTALENVLRDKVLTLQKGIEAGRLGEDAKQQLAELKAALDELSAAHKRAPG